MALIAGEAPVRPIQEESGGEALRAVRPVAATAALDDADLRSAPSGRAVVAAGGSRRP